MLDLRRLRHFTTTATTRSFVRAAEALGLSQPALSRSIQALEQEYGLQLFHRHRGALGLTPAGEMLLEQARRLLGEAATIDQQLRLLAHAEVGQVALGLGPLPASLFLPALLAEVIQTRPGIQVNATVNAGPEIVRRTVAGALEFCCCAEELIPAADRVDSLPLVTLPIVRLVRASHPLCRGEGAPEDFPVVGGSGAVETKAYNPQIVCDDYDILRRVTLASNAVWLTAPECAREELARGDLVQLPRTAGEAGLKARLVLFRPRNRNLSPACAYVVNVLRRLAASP